MNSFTIGLSPNINIKLLASIETYFKCNLSMLAYYLMSWQKLFSVNLFIGKIQQKYR